MVRRVTEAGLDWVIRNSRSRSLRMALGRHPLARCMEQAVVGLAEAAGPEGQASNGGGFAYL
jgi:hypothetical protein